MIANLFAAAVLLAIVAISARVYDHRGRRHADGKSERIRAPGGFAVVYRFIQISVVIAGVGALVFDHPWLLEWHDDPVLALGGAAVALGGLGLFLAARRALGRHYSPCFDSFVPEDVVREGVYGRIRHPIYTSNFLIVGGLALASGSLWLAGDLVLLLVYYTLSARHEEVALAARFPAYREHLGRSGRFLPPLRAG